VKRSAGLGLAMAMPNENQNIATIRRILDCGGVAHEEIQLYLKDII